MEERDLLLGAQLKHMVDIVDAKLDRIELNQVHLKEITPNKGGQASRIKCGTGPATTAG